MSLRLGGVLRVSYGDAPLCSSISLVSYVIDVSALLEIYVRIFLENFVKMSKSNLFITTIVLYPF